MLTPADRRPGGSLPTKASTVRPGEFSPALRRAVFIRLRAWETSKCRRSATRSSSWDCRIAKPHHHPSGG